MYVVFDRIELKIITLRSRNYSSSYSVKLWSWFKSAYWNSSVNNFFFISSSFLI